jgi:hypothetical protein
MQVSLRYQAHDKNELFRLLVSSFCKRSRPIQNRHGLRPPTSHRGMDKLLRATSNGKLPQQLCPTLLTAADSARDFASDIARAKGAELLCAGTACSRCMRSMFARDIA